MTKDEYYLEIAKAVASKSPCLNKRYGAIIVKDDVIIATGYNGPARGEKHCEKCTKTCTGKDYDAYQVCPAIHAEQNAIIAASREQMLGATMYLYGIRMETGEEFHATPCEICFRLLKNSGIVKVVSIDGACCFRDTDGILRRI